MTNVYVLYDYTEDDGIQHLSVYATEALAKEAQRFYNLDYAIINKYPLVTDLTIVRKQKALNKLTVDERKLLGLEALVL